MKQKLIILAFLLLLIPLGISFAQSSGSYINQRFALFSGDSADSDSYSITNVVGQPAAGSSQSDSYTITSGFIPVLQHGGADGSTIWLPVVSR